MSKVYNTEELGITKEEKFELEMLEQNEVDFVLGLKRLIKDTGVHVSSFDFSPAIIVSDRGVVGILIENEEFTSLKRNKK